MWINCGIDASKSTWKDSTIFSPLIWGIFILLLLLSGWKLYGISKVKANNN